MRTFPSWVIGALALIFAAFGGHAAAGQGSGTAKLDLNAKYQLSGPYVHKNLSVYYIHGKTEIKGKRLIPLGEALDKGLVVIHETGDVNQLAASNRSPDEFVFIQSGDIVKGGRQDRTLSQDVILPPKSDMAVLDSFCVEQGRWRKRGGEKAEEFSSSEKSLSSKQLKLAAKKSKSQQEVWQAVAVEQEHLGRKVGQSVRSAASATSLQLSLENEGLAQKSSAYQQALLPAGRRAKDAIGFAYAINGRFTTADIYGDAVLFQALLPKLIQTAAYEAISLFDEKKPAAPVAASAIKRQLTDAFASRKKTEPSSHLTKRLSGETKANYAFETKDEADQIVHLNIINKE